MGAPLLSFIQKNPFESEVSPDIEIYATNWGFRGTTDEFCKRAKDAGYVGIEVWAPLEKSKQDELGSAVGKYDLKLGMLTGNSGKVVSEHLANFERSLDSAISLKPQFINCHSGRDHFNHEEGSLFIDMTERKSKESGLPIYHETHRGKLMFSAPTAEFYLRKYESLQFTLDISHWCCVHESLLSDQKERVDKVLKRTSHIHSRIGFQEGPQIPDPRDDQFQSAIEAHFTWWDQVVRMKAERGEKLTMTTEFGPPGYMWTLPYTKAPVANNWEINLVMKELWEERYL